MGNLYDELFKSFNDFDNSVNEGKVYLYLNLFSFFSLILKFFFFFFFFIFNVLFFVLK